MKVYSNPGEKREKRTHTIPEETNTTHKNSILRLVDCFSYIYHSHVAIVCDITLHEFPLHALHDLPDDGYKWLDVEGTINYL